VQHDHVRLAHGWLDALPQRPNRHQLPTQNRELAISQLAFLPQVWVVVAGIAVDKGGIKTVDHEDMAIPHELPVLQAVVENHDIVCQSFLALIDTALLDSAALCSVHLLCIEVHAARTCRKRWSLAGGLGQHVGGDSCAIGS
jgi:hypothetical protein